MMADMGMGSTTATTAAPAGPLELPPSGIPACDAYGAALQAYLACDKVPQPTRDAARASLQPMWASFGSLADASTTAETRKAAGEACAQGAIALRQSAQTIGCELPAATAEQAVEPAKPGKKKAKGKKKAP
jgi:hypothetical protein